MGRIVIHNHFPGGPKARDAVVSPTEARAVVKNAMRGDRRDLQRVAKQMGVDESDALRRLQEIGDLRQMNLQGRDASPFSSATLMGRRRSTAFQEGYRDAGEGKSRTANPWRAPKERKDWDAGYDARMATKSQDERAGHYKPYAAGTLTFTAEVDRGGGTYERKNVTAKSEAEAKTRLQEQFGSWAKIKGVRQVDAAHDGKTVYDLPDGSLLYVSQRGSGYYIEANKFDAEAKNEAELKEKLRRWGARGPVGHEHA